MHSGWTATGVSTRTPALVDGHLYVTGELDFTYSYDADGCGEATCEPVESFRTGRSDDQVVTRPIVAGSGDDAVLFTVSTQGYLDAYPAVGCEGSDSCQPVRSSRATVRSRLPGIPAER